MGLRAVVDEQLEALTEPEAGVRAKVMEVTPAMAEKWLEVNTANRSVSDQRVDAYAEDMKAGRWKLNNQGIAIGKDGRLYDGQHRLWAVMKSGATVPMLVVNGLSEEARSTIDKLRPRQVADDLTMLLGIKNSRAVVARLNIVAELLTGTSRGRAVTYGQTLELLERYRTGIAWANERFPESTRLGVAPVVGALVLAHRKVPEWTKKFGDAYKTGEGLTAGSPALALRNAVLLRPMTKARDPSLVLGRKTLAALRAYMEGRTIGKLQDSPAVVTEFK